MLRTALRPGDFGRIVALHGDLYAREHGFDCTFEAYVAAPLAEFVMRSSPRERIWLEDIDGRIEGSIAIVAESDTTAQLRWFLVAPEARGTGLGRRLLEEAIGFSRATGYERIILWTVSALERARRLYETAGFRRVDAHDTHQWGVAVTEEKYELTLR